jgi:mono/diheme cytochrome c family protein
MAQLPQELCSIIVKRLGKLCVARNRIEIMPSEQNGSAVKARFQLYFVGGMLAGWLAIFVMVACDAELRKSDAELGLNAQQSAGRRVYDAECDRCHQPYSTRGRKGPGLKGVFQHKYLSLSGLPANDERVADIIRLGRNEMPGFSQKLSPQDMQDLLAYLHTL